MNRYVQRGSTDQSAWVQLLNSDGDYVTGLTYSDVTITVRRFLGGRLVSELSLTPTELTAIDDPHADGGFVEDSSRKRYRVDLQDAAVATGLDSADKVELKVEATGVVGNTSEEIMLVDYEWQSSERSLTTAATTAIGATFLGTALTKGTAGTIERAFWQILKTQAVIDGTAVADAGNTVMQFQTNLTAPDGQYDHMIILFTSNGLEGEARPINTYVQTNGVITLQEGLTETPVGDEEFIILPQHAHPISEIQAGLATSSDIDDLKAAIGPGSGTGEKTITVHVTNDTGGANLFGCSVTAKDSADLVKALASTDSNGEGVLYLETAPHTIVVSREGFVTKGTDYTVTVDDTVEISLVPLPVLTPVEEDYIRVLFRIINGEGTPVENATIVAGPDGKNQVTLDNNITVTQVSTTTDESGLASLDLVQSELVKWKITVTDGSAQVATYNGYLPSTGTEVEFEDLILDPIEE